MVQALRQGKRHTIGVVVPRLHLAIFSEILQGNAIIACVDVQGLGARRAIKERGINRSRIKVISLTGHAVGGMLRTSMTSMEMPAHEMGEKASAMVIEEIEAPSGQKPAPQHLVFSVTLVEREST